MKKGISIFLVFALLFLNLDLLKVKAEINEKAVTATNLELNNGNGAKDLTENLDSVKDLNEGTIIARFYKSTTGVMSLIGASNNATASGYMTVYVNGDVFGIEIRTQTGSTVTNLDHYNTTKKMNTGINTLAVKVTSGEGYKLFLNGELIRDVPDTTTNFFSSVDGLNKLYVGKTARGAGGNNYNYSGSIDFVDVYSKPISDADILKITGETNIGSESQYYPDGVRITDPLKVYKAGDFGSNYFRIPSLLTTKEGTVLAGIDVRYTASKDSPNNIDAGLKRKELGKDWDEGQIVMDFPDSASVIDMSLLQDNTTNRIYMIMTHFANGYGFPNSKTGSGYTTIDGVRYRSLYNTAGEVFTIREDGRVYNSANERTNYTVDADYNIYESGIKKGNVLGSSSPLKVYGTSYLLMTYSDDDGKTWSRPVEMNKYIKSDWMRFLGTGPGKGIQIENGEFAGRLVFPIYLTNAKGFQSSAVIYSDDHGITWEIGETATDGRDMGNGVIGNAETTTSGNQLTESQVVEMPDGQLKLFMRNTGNYVRIATSFDGGATWEDNVEEDTKIREPYCQLSVINYSKPIDGKPAVIFSNPNASSRQNGTVRIGLINETGTHENGRTKYTFEWKYQKSIQAGFFSYSALTELPNGDIGILYEPDVVSSNYQEMSIDYLKFNLEDNVEAAKISNIEIIDKASFYEGAEEITVKITYNSAVSVIGDRDISIKLGNNVVNLEYVNNENNTSYYYKGVIPEGSERGSYNMSLLSNSNRKVYNLFSHVFIMNSDLDTQINTVIKDKEDINSDFKIDISDLSALAIEYNVSNVNEAYDIAKDLNKDGIIDLFDLVMVSNKVN